MCQIENSSKPLSETQKNENYDIRESRFSIGLKYCVGYGKKLSAREGYELWPCEPFRMMRNDGRPLLFMPSNPDAIEVSAAGASW